MWYIEIIGIVATVFIVISMSVNTSSWKGDVFMRAGNIIGSLVFVVYGALLPAISTGVLNGILVIVNFYYLIKLLRMKNKESVQTPKTTNEDESVAIDDEKDLNNEIDGNKK